jgi:glutamate receptor, ionotropic, invertebrate
VKFRCSTTSGGRIPGVSERDLDLMFFLVDLMFLSCSTEICSRDEKQKDTKANSLGVGNIGGVFVVLLCGLAFAVLVAIVEFCYKTKKDNFNDPLNLISSKNSLCAEMTDELCFALSCKNANHQRQAFKKTICNECKNSNNLFLKSQSNMMNDAM